MRKTPLLKLVFAVVLLAVSAFGLLNVAAQPAQALICPPTRLHLNVPCYFIGITVVGFGTCACTYKCADLSIVYGPFGNC